MRSWAVIAASLVALAASARGSAATTYYVDSTAGSDGNAGTAPSQAWRTLARVNAATFAPGDRLLFRAGGSWTGMLRPNGSGTDGRPIVIDAYGEGPRPAIRGDGGIAAVLLDNQEYWEISGLEVTNDAPAEGLRRGVLVRGGNLGRALRHVYLRGLDVHHVKGKLGAEMAEKTTGGIGFEIRGTNSQTRFDDILVERCTIRTVDNTGLYTYSDYMPHPRDPRWDETRFTNVRIRENRLTDIGKNAMAVRASLAPLIERNVIEGAAARLHGNALYVFGCKDAVIQFNEVSRTRFERIEGAAFDSDYNSEGTIIQYNYSHENGGGLVNLCNNPASKPPRGFNDGTIVRYNISQNETDRVIAFDGTVTNTLVHNNIIFVGPGLAPRIVEFDVFGEEPGYATGARFINNIVVNLGNGTYDWGGSRDVVFDSNCFFGNHPPSEPPDSHKLTGDPLLVAPGTGGAGLDSVGGYRLRPGSPCRDSGARVSSPGARDFWGNPLFTGLPDRGAHEATAERYLAPVFDTVETTPDVPFRTVPVSAGGTDELRLDIYRPGGDRERRRPAIIWVHGGGFRRGTDRKQGYIVRMATEFARRGYVSVAPDYRVRERPDADRKQALVDALDDVRAALSWLRLNSDTYGVDPERIAVGGGSAGGRIAVNLAAENAETTSRKRNIFALVALWGSPDSSLWLKEPGRQFPPTLLIHGTADQTVPFADSERLARALERAGAEVLLHPITGAAHTPIGHIDEIIEVAAAFVRSALARLGRGPDTSS